jgi:hypothetical protein
VDQGAPVQKRTAVGSGGDLNGLTDHVAAVEAARERLGRDLEVLQTEVRAQVGQSMEKVLWKLAAAVAALGAGMVTRKALIATWRSTKGQDPPDNPAAADTSWGDALSWTLATTVGAAVAALVAQRGAAAVWQKATGHAPPGIGRELES